MVAWPGTEKGWWTCVVSGAKRKVDPAERLDYPSRSVQHEEVSPTPSSEGAATRPNKRIFLHLQVSLSSLCSRTSTHCSILSFFNPLLLPALPFLPFLPSFLPSVFFLRPNHSPVIIASSYISPTSHRNISINNNTTRTFSFTHATSRHGRQQCSEYAHQLCQWMRLLRVCTSSLPSCSHQLCCMQALMHPSCVLCPMHS